MRKASREMPTEWAYEIMDKAPYITVAMTDEDGTPYAVEWNNKDTHYD